eukprot:g2363.t1
MVPFACFIISLGVMASTLRRRSLRQARRMAQADRARYDELWRRLLQEPGFCEALQGLEGAWHEIQARATKKQKLQAAPSLYALLCDADKLNDVLQAKMYATCVRHNGTFHRSDVKAEPRAFQKVFRSYGGDWRKLCDLVRCSLVFDSVADIEACLRDIGADGELEVLAAGNDKMRLREGHSGGYRDVQLCVRLNNAETRARDVQFHFAEVQLHLASVAALKSDGGHRSYVMWRNLSGK